MQFNNSSDGSSTQVIRHEQCELQDPGQLLKHMPQQQVTENRRNEDSTPPATAHLQKWNHPRINMYRCFSTFWSFICLGANDGAYGALIPYLERYYGINYTVVSLVFLSPIVGYSACALLNNTIHVRFGQRGVAIIMSGSHLIAYLVISQHPPYPVLVVVFILAGFGNGLGDSGWNAWIGDMANANEVLGFLHAFYGLGAALAPIIATSLVTKGWPWWSFYYFMIGAAAIEIIMLVGCFWKADGRAFREEHPQTSEQDKSSPQISPVDGSPVETGFMNKFKSEKSKSKKSFSRTKEALTNKVTWL
jgi:MFS family permease